MSSRHQHSRSESELPEMSDLSHAACTKQLAGFQTGLLPEDDSTVVAEHMASCPNCRLFSEQIEETSGFLEGLPPRDPSEQLAESLADVIHTTSAMDAPDVLLRQLCRLADSFDPAGAEDLVQQTFLAAIEHDPRRLELAELARDLVDRALNDVGPRSRGLEDFAWPQQTSVSDPDADTAELFYPDFYESGPEIGQFVDSPNIWGRTNTLTPEEDIDTDELYGVVERAMTQLPAPLGQLVQLVDVEQLPLMDAASVLRLGSEDAAEALNRARIHVRGAVDEFLA